MSLRTVDTCEAPLTFSPIDCLVNMKCISNSRVNFDELNFSTLIFQNLYIAYVQERVGPICWFCNVRKIINCFQFCLYIFRNSRLFDEPSHISKHLKSIYLPSFYY